MFNTPKSPENFARKLAFVFSNNLLFVTPSKEFADIMQATRISSVIRHCVEVIFSLPAIRIPSPYNFEHSATQIALAFSKYLSSSDKTL